MKLSIAWIFDHIDADWHKQDIPHLVNLFNQRTAEVEAFYPITFAFDTLFLGQVKSSAQETMELYVPELQVTVELPKRAGDYTWYLLKRNGTQWRYAQGKDFHQETMGELPSVYIDDALAAGGWKRLVEHDDYILEVDNKSITHRPDLWSHRGFAREVAILLDLPLKPLEDLVSVLPVKHYATESKISNELPFQVRVQQPALIKRFALTYFNSIEHRSSLLWMLSRLCRVDSKPIDAIVDMTNYVMLDVGQPLHAFDAQKIATRTIEPRLAKAKERLKLLDDELIELCDTDIVITDGQQPLALAGIMGGAESAVSQHTQTILLEAANFDATTIRHSAARHKKRTESAARFEKTLDPNLTVVGIERFAKLLNDAGIEYQTSEIASVGAVAEPLSITITHAYIIEHLGVEIPSSKIISLFKALGCIVDTHTENELITYQVVVPTARSTKDIRIKQDLVEEIGRLYGYERIPAELPYKQTKPSHLAYLYQQRQIKQLLSFGFKMREVKNYAFYNASFLQELRWKPEHPVTIQSPVSEQYSQLVTSLIPGLLANITENHTDYDALRFFEWGRIWQQETGTINEQAEVAGIFYTKKEPQQFYASKAYLEHLFAMLHLPVTWHKEDSPIAPWFAPYQTARIMYEDIEVGHLGIIDTAFTHHLYAGYASAFTLNATFLSSFVPQAIAYQAVSKYPAINRDISVMVSPEHTVAQIKQLIQACSSHIKQVDLIDFFEKPEWEGRKSLAFRITLQDAHKTLTHEEAEHIYALVVNQMNSIGVQIR